MDTIRTVYIDSQHSTERNGSYVYDLQGGIAVPEGARVYVDNVSFTNTFSEEVTEDNQFLYLKTFESTQVPDFNDQVFTFGTDGPPAKDLLHSRSQNLASHVFIKYNKVNGYHTDCIY